MPFFLSEPFCSGEEVMISNAVRTDIEHWASRKDQNPMFQLAKAGRMTPAMVRRYIANITYLVGLTLSHIHRAEQASRALGDEGLAAHYAHKFEEETGHAVWGEQDLDRLATM